MPKYVSYLFVLIWLSYLLSSGIFLFSKGFLLSRVAQSNINKCHKFNELKCRNHTCSENEIANEILKNVNGSSDVCLPTNSKVLLIVIDALKYDFGVFKPDLTDPLPYENKMPIFHTLLQQHPTQTRMLKFIADPPTTTLQRLKGLTTGSLPTFIDIGSNFATPEINEDNIIDQIVHANLSTVFMGDNTWLELFPNRFGREHGFPSFDIYDLDTVDNKLKQLLPLDMKKTDWDFLVTHFLGVDHCGHKYGPLHKEMARKLSEMNTVLEDVVEKMEDDTVLIVIGDHGMTLNGDHGGGTDDEVEALFFMFSKGQNLVSEDYKLNNGSIQQIDLVPTLAAILGVPIPYSNLGAVQYDLIPDMEISGFKDYEMLLLHGWRNTIQIYKYFSEYAHLHKGTFKKEQFEELEQQFIILSHRANSIYTAEAFQNFSKDLNAFLRNILQRCQAIWIKFDANLMSKGLLIVFITVLGFFLLVHNLTLPHYHKIFNNGFMGLVLLSNAAGYPLAYFLNSTQIIIIEFTDILFYSCIYSFAILSLNILQNWVDISDNWYKNSKTSSKIVRVIFLIFISTFYSNSFTVEEQKILNYLLIGILLFGLYSLISSLNKKRFWRFVFITLVSIVVLRVSFYLFKCREEQKGCAVNFEKNSFKYSSEVKSETTPFDMIGVIVLALFTTVSKMYLKSMGNLSGTSLHVMFFRYSPTVATICAAGHFLLAQNPAVSLRPVHIDGLAWVVYAITVTHIIIFLIDPLLLFIMPQSNSANDTVKYFHNQNIIPELFNHMRNKSNASAAGNNDANDADRVPIVYGLGTVYSSSLIALGTSITILLSLLLGKMAAAGMLVVICVAIVICAIGSANKGAKINDIQDYLQPTFLTLAAYLILTHFTFYATSHQPTLSQIDWHAAFVGRSKNNENQILSALLIILSTFSGQIFFLLFYPIIVIAPFLLNLLMPPKSKKDETFYMQVTITEGMDVDMTRGELSLYEIDDWFVGMVFKTGCQLAILQGARIFCAMLACTIHCRHLMVWKIFAPRFIFEGIATYISFVAIVLGFLVIVRIHKALDQLILNINKKNR